MNPQEIDPQNSQPQPQPAQTAQAVVAPTVTPEATPAFVGGEPARPQVPGLLNGNNIVKKYVMFRQIMGMITGVFLFFFGIIVGVIFAFSNTLAALIFGGIISGLGVLLFVLSLVGRRQLKKSIVNQPSYNTYQNTETAVEYAAPSVASSTPTVAQQNETIGSWLGPVSRSGMAGVSYGVVSKEVDNQAENTLLFTNQQVIGLMVTPQDLADLQQSSGREILNQITNYAPDTAFDKGMDFAFVNLRHWQDIVAKLQSQPLQAVLQSHFNFNIPYSDISSVQVHNSVIDKGLTFHLKDGKKLAYTTLKKDQLPVAVDFLKQYLTIS